MATPEKRLLVIDDDEGLRELVELSMRKAGFVVLSAEDGAQGLAKIPAFKPHLIVLDLMMPVLDGFAVLHKLQEAGLTRIPVVVVTAYSEKANQAIVSSEPNVVALLQKPIKFGEFIPLVNGLLSK